MQTIFDLVKLVLDEIYVECKNKYADCDKEIISKIKELSTHYPNLRNPEVDPLNYSEPSIRFAYVYKYVAAHADYLYQILDTLSAKDEDLKTQFTSSPFRLTCIGGGPGSDVIGFLKLLFNLDVSAKVTCYICDGEQAWADSWAEINEQLPEKLTISTNFQPLNVRDQYSWSAQKKFLQADLFTLNYFVSEIMRFHDDNIQSFWDTLFSQSKKGSMFLYIDNGHSDFSNYFDEICQKYDLKLIAKKDRKQYTPSYEEQSIVLKEYIDKFKNFPKIQTELSFRLLSKN